MWLRQLRLNACLLDFVVQLVGSRLVVEESDSHRLLDFVDVHILYAIQRQYSIQRLVVSLFRSKEVIAIFYLRTTIVVAGGIACLVDDGTNGSTIRAIGVVADEDVVLVQMRSH